MTCYLVQRTYFSKYFHHLRRHHLRKRAQTIDALLLFLIPLYLHLPEFQVVINWMSLRPEDYSKLVRLLTLPWEALLHLYQHFLIFSTIHRPRLSSQTSSSLLLTALSTQRALGT